MPERFSYYYVNPEKRRKADAEKKRRHSEVVRAWESGELTWNEYIRLEKKYRVK